MAVKDFKANGVVNEGSLEVPLKSKKMTNSVSSFEGLPRSGRWVDYVTKKTRRSMR